jgi:hypothetical protein
LLSADGTLKGPHHATLADGTLTLQGNGFAYIEGCTSLG